MKTLAFASRNTKEMIRDKINLFFGLDSRLYSYSCYP